MKVLSVRLKSIFVVGAVLLAVTLGVFFMASLVNDTVSADAIMIPIFNIDKDIKSAIIHILTKICRQ